jgi:hypothetical protein
MSYMLKGMLGAAAIVASFGAAQFASGEDLTVGMRTAGTPDQGVNRVSKADRAPIVAEPVASTQTVAFHVDRLPDTSILVRIPLNHEARSLVPAPSQLKGERKATVACEPVVSVLTEIAKRLEPGRCVT